MPDPVERFITAATAPLADNAELQMMAGQELRSALVVEDVTGAGIAATAELLEQSRSSRGPRICLYLAVALLSAVAAAMVVLDLPRYRVLVHIPSLDFPLSSFRPGHCFNPHTVRDLPPLMGKFTPEEELLVFGDLDPAKAYTAEQFGTAWHKNPKDAALFAEYARALALRASALRKSLPADFLAQAEKVDPGNAYYRLIAARDLLRDTIDGENRGPKKPRYRIKDPAKLAAILQLLEEASLQPRFNSYEGELLMRRLKVLPAGEDLPGRWLAQEFIHNWYLGSSFSVGGAVVAQAHELAAAGDAAGYRKLCATWERTMLLVLRSEGALPQDAIRAGTAMPGIFWDLSRAAQTLKLDAEMQRYREMSRRLNHRKSRFVDWLAAEGALLRKRSGTVYNRYREDEGDSLVPVTLDESALKPGRLAEHAFASRFLACAAWIVMLLAALLTAVCRFRHGGQVRRLSGSLVRVLGAREQAWIIGCGVLAPFVIHLLLEHFTPIGGRNWTVTYTDWAALLRMAAIIVLILLLPSAIAARFLQRRYGFLGWKSPAGGELLVCLMPLAVWLAGGLMGWLGRPSNKDLLEGIIKGGWFLLLIPAICTIFEPLNVLLGRRHRTLEPMTACRAILPARATAMLLLAAVTFLYHAEEKYWTRRDKLTEPDASVPAWSRIDYEAAEQARAELLEILEAKP